MNAAETWPDYLSPVPPDENSIGASWEPQSVSETLDGILSGTLTRPEPHVGTLHGGTGLFYPGRVNGVAGESGSGKTWTALAATAQELTTGSNVVYVDLEDDIAGVVGRLLDMGTEVEAIRQRFVYIHPDEPTGPVALAVLAQTILALKPTLVVIDSTGEALALDGAKPNADEEVAAWFRRLPRAIADTGPAVVILDHVVKIDDSGLWPIGSQRKRAAITGAQYMQRTVLPFSKDATGQAKLICAKDRNGNYRAGQHVADLHVSPVGDGVAIELRAAVERGDGQPWRPTGLMEKVSRAIEGYDSHGALSTSQIHTLIGGNRQHAISAISALVGEGFLGRKPGARGSHLHTLVEPYRQVNDPKSDRYTGPKPASSDGQNDQFPTGSRASTATQRREPTRTDTILTGSDQFPTGSGTGETTSSPVPLLKELEPVEGPGTADRFQNRSRCPECGNALHANQCYRCLAEGNT